MNEAVPITAVDLIVSRHIWGQDAAPGHSPCFVALDKLGLVTFPVDDQIGGRQVRPHGAPACGGHRLALLALQVVLNGIENKAYSEGNSALSELQASRCLLAAASDLLSSSVRICCRQRHTTSATNKCLQEAAWEQKRSSQPTRSEHR